MVVSPEKSSDALVRSSGTPFVKEKPGTSDGIVVDWSVSGKRIPHIHVAAIGNVDLPAMEAEQSIFPDGNILG